MRGCPFYFDVRDGDTLVPDDEGLELPSIKAARDEATRALAEMAKDALPQSFIRELAIEVRGETKESLLRTRLKFETERLR